MTKPVELETDPRFPSGRWIGYFLDKRVPPGRFPTELYLTFSKGELRGEGRDHIGEFTVSGRYELADGRCHWVKQYVGKHSVAYEGFNEGKGIWGTWTVSFLVFHATGGFHIWPEEMPDPTKLHLTEEAEVPTDLVSV